MGRDDKNERMETALFLWFWYRYCRNCRAFIRLDWVDKEHQDHNVSHPDLLDLRDNLGNYIEGRI